MSDQPFAHFEARLERLIEGAFAQIFSKTVRAQDIALQLARALQTHAVPGPGGDPRPIAPDYYRISLHPSARTYLLERQPALAQILSQHLVELATESGYVLNTVPQIEVVGDSDLGVSDVSVTADHQHPLHNTAVMERVTAAVVPVESQAPRNSQIIINGQQTVHLKQPIVNIGRGRGNQIVLDDPYVSRHHAQLRLRFGRFTLFDIQSQTGTFVNDVRIREHRLQSGDVIRMGRMHLVYLEDDPLPDSPTGGHDSIES